MNLQRKELFMFFHEKWNIFMFRVIEMGRAEGLQPHQYFGTIVVKRICSPTKIQRNVPVQPCNHLVSSYAPDVIHMYLQELLWPQECPRDVQDLGAAALGR